MNDQMSNKESAAFWPLFGSYLYAIARHWIAIIMAFGLTLLDFGERLFGTWWVVPPWLRLTSALIGFTAAQFLAYSDLHIPTFPQKDRA